MDIHHLRIFVAVYQSKSFSKASELLYLSQPTISEHMKNLELELGCRLFDRVGRTIIPTKDSEVLFPRTMHILDEMNKLKEDLQSSGSVAKGHLVIGASTIPGTYILPAVASEFKKKNPEVSFQIVIEDSQKITRLVLNHEILIGFVGAEMATGKIEYLPFIEDELILAASPEFIPTDVLGLRELEKIPFVLREEGSGTRKVTENFLSKKNIPIQRLNIVGILGSTDSVKQALKAGLGASILSKISIQDELQSGILKEVKIRGLKMMRNFYLISHKKRTLPNPYHAFSLFLKERSEKQS